MTIMTRCRQRWAIALLVMMFSHATTAASDTSTLAREWITRMAQAAMEVSYEGTFVYLQGPHLETMHIVQNAATGRQRLSSLNGVHREVVVSSEYGVCLLPNQRLAFNTAGRYGVGTRMASAEDLDRLESLYAFTLAGTDRVAGHPVQVVDLVPRDDLRYGYRLWLEESTGVLLRSALLDEHQAVLEQLMFTHVTFGSVPPIVNDTAEAAGSPAESAQKAPGVKSADGETWVLSELPQGYSQVMQTRYLRSDGSETEHLVVSDGLATVSIFVEVLPEQGAPVLEGDSRMGAMSAFGRVLDGHQILVVGEAPQGAVKLISAAVSRTP